MTETYQITVEPVGAEITCREDQTILDACLRAGVWVPHSCTHGTCGTCKVEVLDGEVDHGDSSSFALMDFERDDGKTLLCCATPRSDVVVEADLDADDETPAHAVQDYTATVVSIEDVATDTRRVVLELDRATCHSQRGVHLGERPYRLLRAVRGLTLLELANSEECCGFGGTFSVKNPDVSVAMGSDKARHVRETGAEVLVAADRSCLMHIGGLLSRQRSGIRVMHLAEVLAATDTQNA